MKKHMTLGSAVFALIVALSAPVGAAAAMTQLSGVAFFDAAGVCSAGTPPGYGDFTTVMEGSLEGCWYTKIETQQVTPSGVYLETGEEVFVGSLDGVEGTFATTYKFQSKWDPDVTTGVEVHGRCEHPIVAGSGTGGFAGATGRLDFKDDVVNLVFNYRGHIELG